MRLTIVPFTRKENSKIKGRSNSLLLLLLLLILGLALVILSYSFQKLVNKKES
jgi:hypothetical protein